MKPMDMPRVMYDTVVLKGGLDLITPTLSLKPGVARSSVNWECNLTGGYSTIQGYERFDGRSAPSDSQFVVFNITYVNAPSLGDTVVGQTSGATGVVCGVDSVSGFLAVTRIVGVFVASEQVMVGVTNTGTLGTTLAASVSSGQTLAIYSACAADQQRSLIAAVPGSGPVRGAVMFNGTVYAFRNNLAATSTDMYASSSTGWQAVNLGSYVTFTSGTAIINDGDTVTGFSSGATGIARRVSLRSGTWGSTATGIIVFTSITGIFQAAESLRVGGVAKATCSGAQTATTLLPGGKFEFVINNFGGASGAERLYGCDGVNKAWEFDGTSFVPIATGMASDTPKHIIAHRNYLFLTFGASLQWSSLGAPYQWSAVFGAGEVALAEPITGMLVQPGANATAALAIYTDNNTCIMYGSSSSTWNLVTFNTGTGALDYSVQNLLSSYAFCDRGVTSLQTSLNYGNFDMGMLTYAIQPFITTQRTKLATSCINRQKAQYRTFFNDGWGMYLTIANGKYMGAMPVWFPDAVFNCSVGTDLTGTDVTLLCGTSSGYVYTLDKGTSFDGAAITTALTLNWNAVRSPRLLKRYRKCALEASGTGYAKLSVSYILGYGKDVSGMSPTIDYATGFNQTLWDSFTWDSFTWDGVTLAPSEIELMGTGENIAVTIGGSSNYYGAVTLNSIIISYSYRRGLR